MAMAPEKLGLFSNITTTTAAPSLATDGVATKNHRFVNVWIRTTKPSTGNVFIDGVYVRVWYYRSGFGWVPSDLPASIWLYYPLYGGSVLYLEPRGSVERVYVQIVAIVGTPATVVTQMLFEGVTYDSSDSSNAAPQPLGSVTNASVTDTINTLVVGSPTQGYATNNNRFTNIWVTVTGDLTQGSVRLYVAVYNATLNAWLGCWQSPLALLSAVSANGGFYQVETRGAERVAVGFSGAVVVVTPVTVNYAVDGVTYS